MSDFYQTLIAELQNDPLNVGYANMTDEEVAASLAMKNRIQVYSRFVSLRGLAAALEAEEYATVKSAINQVAQLDPRVVDMLEFLKMPCDDGGTTGGIDFGHPSVRALIDSLPGVPDATKAKMKALAERPCARWEEIGLEQAPNQYHIQSARQMMR